MSKTRKLGWLIKVRWAVLFAVLFAINISVAVGQDEDIYKEFSGYVTFDNRYFLNQGAYPGQHRNYLSFSFQPEYLMEWQDGDKSIKFTGFARFDQYDDQRTHFDIRELYYQTVKSNWELSIGIKKIFWGVTESVHLVDIINQTDFVESFDGEQKLGQPMLHYSLLSNFGTFDLLAMPYFRKRQFPGREGRLRTSFVLERNDAVFEDNAKEFRPDFAFRWSHYIGAFDIGVSHFYGTGREPITFKSDGDGNFNLLYGIINQTGFDIQATTGPFLWKFESIIRRNEELNMFGLAAGFEYTFGNIFNSGLDIGIVGEYLYDDRDERSFSSLQNDIFLATRLAFNDTQSTEILFGGIFDREHSSKLFSLEGSRRIGNSYKATIEARIFEDIDNEEFLFFIREDSFLQFTIAKYF